MVASWGERVALHPDDERGGSGTTRSVERRVPPGSNLPRRGGGSRSRVARRRGRGPRQRQVRPSRRAGRAGGAPAGEDGVGRIAVRRVVVGDEPRPGEGVVARAGGRERRGGGEIGEPADHAALVDQHDEIRWSAPRRTGEPALDGGGADRRDLAPPLEGPEAGPRGREAPLERAAAEPVPRALERGAPLRLEPRRDAIDDLRVLDGHAAREGVEMQPEEE